MLRPPTTKSAQPARGVASREIKQNSDLNTLEPIDFLPSKEKFPGSRSMGLTFKRAVNEFLSTHYGEEIKAGHLCMADLRCDPLLYQAVRSYKQRFGNAPFNIPSIRQKAIERFNKVAGVGYENAERRDRDAANKMAKRKLAKRKI